MHAVSNCEIKLLNLWQRIAEHRHAIAAAGAMEYEGATCVTEVSPAASGALTAVIAHRGGCTETVQCMSISERC